MGGPQRAGRQHVVAGPFLVGHRAHGPSNAHPAEDPQDQQQNPEIGNHHRGDDDDDVEVGDRRPDLDQALEEEIECAAEIPHGAADADAGSVGGDQQRQGEENGDPEPVDQPGQDVATGGIRAAEMPVRQRRGGGRQGVFAEIVFKGIVGHGRHEQPVALVLFRKTGRQFTVVGLVLVAQSEDRPGNGVAVGGPVKLPVERDHQRPAVDQQFGPQGKHDHRHQNDEGTVAPADGLEPPEFFDGQRVESKAHASF